MVWLFGWLFIDTAKKDSAIALSPQFPLRLVLAAWLNLLQVQIPPLLGWGEAESVLEIAD